MRETRQAPKPLSRDDVIEQYKTFEASDFWQEQVIFGCDAYRKEYL